ncbi:DEAD/DEAH box helicase [Solilutibacter tolerans]|uniref:ATP-dependent RNA helicase DeaD n=1 Tax=Solilutibacter tolerans TaxID=1604334 RepID=A0A1N6XFP4_9GAMM|nr:DEAD/DEAH box helicase [Lysobacter tolerans]SIR01061.1 ATP-dependent RNA helicase CsdA [Lysobacter tolerans]
MSADTPNDTPTITFADLGLPESLLKALTEVGYETPSPIQAATIPPLLEGRDVLGQAQTGTGKTAAFALPILADIDPKLAAPQALVLAPTRELAIQVSEAFQKYAHHIPGFHVLPIYGGQSYTPQLQALRRGVQVVVGTPGRVIDHLNRGSLDLSRLKTLVLDEADEMLRMGFVDDVEAVVKKCPDDRRIALFSATMPAPIKRIAQTYLRNPVEVAIKSTTTTGDNIRQRFWLVSGLHKLDAITRILEAETYDAMIVFARTKLGTEELAEKLAARGIAAAAINGDMDQKSRERTIQRLKDGQLDVLVATDVAARGLDVERITHVLNYDIPYDTESYVHRIGRTGRAGRKGEAILFVTPRERGMLRAIERATRQQITPMQLPSAQDVNQQRVSRFRDRINSALNGSDAELFRGLLEDFENERNVPMVEIAAALAQLVQGDTPMFLPNDPPPPPPRERHEKPARNDDYAPRPRDGERAPRPPRPAHDGPDVGMQTYRIEVGHEHRVKPGNIVGAIANEAELEARYIGRVDIRDDYTLVDLPEGMPPELLQFLGNVRVAGRPIRMRLATDDDLNQPTRRREFGHKPRFDDDGGARPRKPGGFKPGGFNKRPGGFNKSGPKKPRDPR